jgi:hypothetical protein
MAAGSAWIGVRTLAVAERIGCNAAMNDRPPSDA